MNPAVMQQKQFVSATFSVDAVNLLNVMVCLNVEMCVHGDVYHDRDLNNRSGCSDVIGCHCALPQIYTQA